MNKLKIILLSGIFGASTAVLSAQTPLEAFLQRVEANSFYVEAGRAEADARIAETRSNNSPADPEIEYGYAPGIEDTDLKKQTYGISQSFAWPGEYAARSKYNQLERQQAEVEFREERQTLLLRAKLLCYELVHAQKRLQVLANQQSNAENLLTLTQRRLEAGEATSIDLSNAKLNAISVNAAFQEGRTAVETKRRQLEMLAGFDDFDATTFAYIDTYRNPDELLREAVESDFSVRAAQLESDKSSRNIAVQRGATLPSFSIGISGERLSPTDSFLGIMAGMSIPLWGGSGQVKTAKAQHTAAQLRSQTVESDVESELLALAHTAEQLAQSLTQYESVGEIGQAMSLLNKSFERQQISVLEYYTNMELYKQVELEFLDREFRFYEALAKLTSYQL